MSEWVSYRKVGLSIAYAPDGSASYVLDNEARNLASSILLTPPPITMPFDFDLELTV